MTFSGKRILGPTLAILVGLSSAAYAGASRATPAVSLDCFKRIPPNLRDDVPHADFPADNSVGEMARYGDEETGQLDQANDEKKTVLWIVEYCEKEEQEALRRVDKRFFLLRWLFPLKPG